VAALLKVATLSGDLARAKREHDAERERARPAEPPVPAGGGEALFMRLLPVLDNIARASRHAQAGAPAATIAEGLVMVLGQLDDALAREGIRRVPAVGLRFDPAQHEAVEHVADVAPAGTVLREELPGYVVGTRLVRAAAVVVSKGGG
jgi:molecular chaperone GrpE